MNYVGYSECCADAGLRAGRRADYSDPPRRLRLREITGRPPQRILQPLPLGVFFFFPQSCDCNVTRPENTDDWRRRRQRCVCVSVCWCVCVCCEETEQQQLRAQRTSKPVREQRVKLHGLRRELKRYVRVSVLISVRFCSRPGGEVRTRFGASESSL